ncbi:ead/Ea22-like family protein [Enterobacter sp. Lyrl_3]|uniref:ead/Ea22-like family protein n=1 Tax=Enterobacter sp. Lyrl_3 TaxID=3110922 RepID=UPI003F7E604A
MSNIDKQELREAVLEADEAIQIMKSDIEVDSGHVDSINAFYSLISPKSVLALLDELEAAERRIAELETDNAYIRNRHKELDLLIGKNILVMQAAIIEWQGTGDARKGLAWIYNTLFGPGELPDEAEKDAQAYFDRKYGPLDEELMTLHRWFWEQSEAERAAAAEKGE